MIRFFLIFIIYKLLFLFKLHSLNKDSRNRTYVNSFEDYCSTTKLYLFFYIFLKRALTFYGYIFKYIYIYVYL